MAERLLRQAASAGARLCVLPEIFAFLGEAAECQGQAEPIPGPTTAWGQRLSAELGIYLVLGSLSETASGALLPFNTSCLLNPRGEIIARYRKLHLFDCDYPGARYLESETTAAGTELVTCAVDSPWNVGLAICYDLRFPEQFRELKRRGANLIALPAAFTAATGCDHWEVLLRARAIENQVYVVAADQYGCAGIKRYGRSMIIDPWGNVIAQASDKPGYIVADIEEEYLRQVRRAFPFGV